jgi:hypothetical protein
MHALEARADLHALEARADLHALEARADWTRALDQSALEARGLEQT